MGQTCNTAKTEGILLITEQYQGKTASFGKERYVSWKIETPAEVKSPVPFSEVSQKRSKTRASGGLASRETPLPGSQTASLQEDG